MSTATESYISFVLAGASASGKTQLWEVTTENATILGVVSWVGRWRCYAFWPHQRTVYEKRCLRDIADFCESRTRAFNAKKRRP